MMKQQKQVLEFMEMCHRRIPDLPEIDPQYVFHCMKIVEEAVEAYTAAVNSDLGQYVDGLIDTMYFCLDSLSACGVDAEPLFDAVHRQNMTKRAGKLRVDGYREKPSNFKHIDLLEVIKRQPRSLHTSEVGK